MVLKSTDEFTGGADADVHAALAAGACVITANNRLARHVRLGYAQRQRAAGRAVWEAPDALPWQAFVERTADLARAQTGSRAPLTAAQESWLWSELVAEQGSEFLCQDRAFGALAAEAWQLLADYALPVPEGGGDRESEVFVTLAQAFARRLAVLSRDDAAHDAARVAEAIRGGQVRPAPRVLWAGFERLTPAQEAVEAACRAIGVPSVVLPLPDGADRTDARIFPSTAAELTAALLWGRERIAADPGGRYALVVPDLAAHRRRIARLAREVFAGHGPDTAAYEISLGPPLAEAPPVAAALCVWRLAGGTVAAAEAASLIQSPFLGGAAGERAARAVRAYEVLSGAAEMDLASVARAVRRGDTPSAQAAFARLTGIARRWPRRSPASAWAETFMGALETLGWPGAAGPGDYQAIAAVHEAMESFATLDAVVETLSYGQALAFIAGVLGDRIFQQGQADAPLQIMGPLEAVGLTFDGLWMMNLHDRVWPPLRPPHPLLPLAFQRAHRLPHAFIEDDVQYANRIVADLARAAPETILSSGVHDGSEPLRPSRILIERGAREDLGPVFAGRAERIFAGRAPLETPAAHAAPLDASRIGPFGAGLLAAQAACPFRALAQYRLRADPLEAPGYGLAPAVRGAVFHKVMELWFTQFPEPRIWQAWDADVRARQIAETVAAAQAAAGDAYAAFPAAFMALEARRMEGALAAFLAREEGRPAFQVVACEKEVTHTCGPLVLRGRIDRSDRVGGRLVLIDYKTGKMPVVDWTTDRPEYPQLLFYAVAEGAEVAGIAYAGLSARDGGYKAWVRDPDLLPGATVVDAWDAATAAWPKLLARLAADFAVGSGTVDPLEGACEYCGRESFCRIGETDGSGDDG